MLQNPKRYTVTSALPYANGPVHIGHLAGVYVPADIYARYLRLRKRDVLFVCGSDEHGVPITIRAEKEGISYQEAVDKYHFQIKKAFEDFGISFDIYSRTSNATHHETGQEFFTKLHEKGVFTEETSDQYFDEKAGRFLADRYITGTCPVCGNPNAYGDQCENCGSTLSPRELINPVSRLSGQPPVLRPTRHWYLPLNKYENWLKDWLLEGHTEWKTNVYGQCKSWIDGGLQPRAVTRDLDWGIPVPLEEAKGKVLYVWFEACLGYISDSKDWAKDVKHDPDAWKPYWQDDTTKLVHFIGKDNIVFHCLMNPVILKEYGGYILPDNVPANEFLNLEGNKISTSRNWAVWLHEYLEEFPGKQDVLRYVLTANAPETKDNDFTWKDFQARNNNELAHNLGNFVNRVISLTHLYYQGKLPARGNWEPVDEALISELIAFPGRIAESIENFRFREALGLVMDVSRAGNKYLAETAPWKTIKTDPERVKTIIHLAAQVVANLAILTEPFLPFTSRKIYKVLNLNELSWDNIGDVTLLAENHTIGQDEILFGKMEDTEVAAQVQKLEDTKKANELAGKTVLPQKETVAFDDFAKMDIRIATIRAAEKVQGSKKLLKLTLQAGIDERVVVSGIAEHYQPADIVGRQVCLLANLAPRDIKGITSQGMILMAEDKDGSLAFVSPEKLIWDGGTVQ